MRATSKPCSAENLYPWHFRELQDQSRLQFFPPLFYLPARTRTTFEPSSQSFIYTDSRCPAAASLHQRARTCTGTQNAGPVGEVLENCADHYSERPVRQLTQVDTAIEPFSPARITFLPLPSHTRPSNCQFWLCIESQFFGSASSCPNGDELQVSISASHAPSHSSPGFMASPRAVLCPDIMALRSHRKLLSCTNTHEVCL